MFKVLLPAVAALGLIAAGAQTRSHEAPAGDAPAMGWHVSYEGELAKLAYGLPNSDQLALMITCAPGDRTAAVYGEVQPRSPRLTRAAAGPVEIDPLSGGDAVETRIGMDDPVLTRLASRGTLAVEGAAGAFTLTATESERRAAEAFLAYCGSAHV